MTKITKEQGLKNLGDTNPRDTEPRNVVEPGVGLIKKESEIGREIKRVASEISQVYLLVESLEGRLAPILGQPNPQDESQEKSPEPQTEIGILISELWKDESNIVNKLQDIINRIEV